MATVLSRKEARRTLKRVHDAINDGGDVNHLNITAMMDMMSILLVFMLKQFAVAQQSMNTGDVQLPHSSSAVKPTPAVNVTVTTQAVIVEGDAVVSIRNGAVDPSSKRDGANGYYITPLVEILEKHSKREKKVADLTGGKYEAQLMIIVIGSATAKPMISSRHTFAPNDFRLRFSNSAITGRCSR